MFISSVLNVKYGDRGNIVSVEGHLSGFIFQEKGQWVSYCRELDLSSCGSTKSKAMENIHEAINLFLDSCIKRGTLEEALAELGWMCRMPDDSIESCRDHKIPKKLLRNSRIKGPRLRGTSWSGGISLGA